MSWVQEWMKRAAPQHRAEAITLRDEISIQRVKAEELHERAAPALKPPLKAVIGHLGWAERTIRDWLLRNPG